MTDHKNRPRPLSPHLTIYKAEYSSMLSIYHRVTGILLAVCLLLFGLVYKIQAYNIENLSTVIDVLKPFCRSFVSETLFNNVLSLLGLFVGAAIIFMLAYHMSNGIRHFFWDYIISTVSKGHVKVTSYMVITLTIVICTGLAVPFLI